MAGKALAHTYDKEHGDSGQPTSGEKRAEHEREDAGDPGAIIMASKRVTVPKGSQSTRLHSDSPLTGVLHSGGEGCDGLAGSKWAK